MDPELAVADAAAQVPEQAQPRRIVPVQVGGVDDDPAAVGLGRVHGHVRGAQQFGRLGTGGGHAQAAVDLERQTVDLEGPPQRAQEPAGGVGDRVGVRVAQQHDELVPAQPREHVVPAQLPGQPLGDGAQQGVPDGVPEGVVDLLEPVQVEHDHGERRAAGGRVVGRRAQFLGQPGPVEQPGQRIGAGALAQLLLRLHAPGVLGLEVPGATRPEDGHEQVGGGQQQDEVVERAEDRPGPVRDPPGQVPRPARHRDEDRQQRHHGRLAGHVGPQPGERLRPVPRHRFLHDTLPVIAVRPR